MMEKSLNYAYPRNYADGGGVDVNLLPPGLANRNFRQENGYTPEQLAIIEDAQRRTEEARASSAASQAELARIHAENPDVDFSEEGQARARAEAEAYLASLPPEQVAAARASSQPAASEADQLSDAQLNMLRQAEQMAISSGQMPEELANEINRYYSQLDQYDMSQFEPNQIEYVTGLMDYLGMPYTQRNLFEVLDNQFGSKNTVSADTLNMLFPGGNSDRMGVLTALSPDNYGQYDPNKQYGAQNQANTQGDLNQAAADATAAIGDVAQPTSAPVREGPVVTPDSGYYGNQQEVTVTPGADALAGAGYTAPTNTIGDVYTGSGTPDIPTITTPDPIVTTPVQPTPIVSDPFQPAPVVPGLPGSINLAPIDTSGVTSPAQNLSMGNIAGAFTSNPPPPAGGQQAYQNFVSPELQAYQAPTMTGAAQGLGSLMSDPLQQQEEENPYLLSSTPTSSVFSRPGG